MEIRIKGSEIRFVYSDQLQDLMKQGEVTTQRVSEVEPTKDNQWQADLSKVGGPLLGPFKLRASALQAEVEWLYANKLPIPENVNG